jgi:hypothetical protein
VVVRPGHPSSASPRGAAILRVLRPRRLRVLTVEITSDTRHRGDRGTLILPGTEATPDVDPGDRIRVIRVFDETLTPGSPEAFGQTTYSYVDFERRPALAWLAAAFLALVLILGRWHGARSLTGLAASLLILLVFIARRSWRAAHRCPSRWSARWR